MRRGSFGVGAVAGLLAAVLIVAGSGISGVAPALYAPAARTISQGGSASSTTTTTTGTGISYSADSGTPTSTVQSNTSQSVSGTPSGAPGTNGIFDVFMANSLVFHSVPSSLATMARQSPSTNLVVLLPVAIAFALGGLLYRRGVRRREGEPEEDAAD